MKLIAIFLIGLLVLSGCSKGDSFQSEKDFGKKFCENNKQDYVDIKVYLQSMPSFSVVCYDFEENISTTYNFSSGYELLEQSQERTKDD